ncbi:hypothetical protein ACFGVR_06800 [Mucilaginibacter sp. AW1-3]
MKKQKAQLLMIALMAIFFSCKKNDQVGQTAGTGQEKQITGSKDNKKTTTNDGDGNIGCSTAFFDPLGEHYHDIGWVEDCDFDAIFGSPGSLGIPGTGNGASHSLYPIYMPPPLHCETCQTTAMGYYFYLLGFSGSSAPTSSDFTAMSTRLASYNAIILSIFGDPLLTGHVNVPPDVSPRRAAIAAYTGSITLPSGVTMSDFLEYVDFAYSRIFAVSSTYTIPLFGPNFLTYTDPVDGVDKINTFGVKILIPAGNFGFDIFDRDNLNRYGSETP